MFCTKCQQFWNEAIKRAEVPERITKCEDVRWSSFSLILHSSLRDLKVASDLRCILCRIIYHTPSELEHEHFLRDHDECLDVLLDIDPDRGPHPILSVTYREPSGDRVRVPRRTIAVCGGVISNGKYCRVRRGNHLTCPDEIVEALRRSSELPNENTGSAGAIQLAASWINECVSNHDGCRVPSTRESSGFVPTRLVDVSKDPICLVNSAEHFLGKDTDRRYVALSHCWGTIQIIRTLKENYQQHLTHIGTEQLSKTFADAILATRNLGFRYIWIDSLCIIQDDSEDWAKEAATMCDVYQYADLTLAAAHASGGNVGCFKNRDGLLQVPFVVEVPQKEFPGSPAHIVFTSYGRSEGLGGPSPPLYGRAWVLQEQILSPRMLIFDGSQLRWECLTTHASERTYSGGMSRHAGHQKAIRKAIVEDEDFFTIGDGAHYQHMNWCYAVMDYTHRGMTQSKDRLVALAGIAQALGRYTKSEYLAGLWSQFFWTGMLWSISHVNEYVSTTQDAFDLDKNPHTRHPEPIAPSWSWASVTVPVVYPTPTITSLDPICHFQSSDMVGGAAVQTGRVWIKGHTRKGFVNAIYPYAIREAPSKKLGHMTMQKHEGQKDRIIYQGRAIDPNAYFLFSHTRPNLAKFWGSDLHPTIQLTRNADWRLVRGTFRPDEIISPMKEITFLAIAQQHAGTRPPSFRTTHEPDDPLSVYTVALVPVRGSGEKTVEYRRVGYAVWTDCAWYGYNCGQKERPGLGVERPGKWTPEHGWQTNDGLFDTLSWWTKWKDLELYKSGGGAKHVHEYEADALPNFKKYRNSVDITEEVVVIV